MIRTGRLSGPERRKTATAALLPPILVVTASLAVSCRLLAAGAPHRTETGIPYRNDADLRKQCVLDIDYPDGGKDLPVLVWFHGGGLTEGTRTIPEELRNSGFVVISPGYRLSTEVPVKTCLEDAAAATAWAFKNAARYGGSPDKIYLGGASAGAYLAAMNGLDKQFLVRHGIDAGKLAGLLLISGQMITHFRVRHERGIPDTTPVVDELAPLYHVRKDAPPVLLITGDRELEMLGRYEESAYFARMMKVAGHTRTKLIELPGSDHGQVIAPANHLLVREIRQQNGLEKPAP